MRWKQGSEPPAEGRLSRPEHAPGGLDDVPQAGGDGKIAERVGGEPPEIVEFVVQHRLAEAQRAANDMIR